MDGAACAIVGYDSGESALKMDAHTVRHLLMRMVSREEYGGNQPAGK